MAVDKSLVALRNNTEPGFLNVTDADGISQAQDNASKIEIVRAIDANLTRIITADTNVVPDTDTSHILQIGTSANRFSTITLTASLQVQLALGNSLVTLASGGASIANTDGGNKSLSVSQLGGILVLDETASPRGLRGNADYTANVQSLDYIQRKWVEDNADTRPLTAAVSDVNTTNTIDASLARRLDVALTADVEVNTISNFTRPVLINVTGGFKLFFPMTNVRKIGTTNYNNPFIRLSRGSEGFGSVIVAEYLNSPAHETRELPLTTTSIDLGELNNQILTRTGTGNENITITNPMLNGFVTIRHTGATGLTVNGQTLKGETYNGSATNVVDIRCVEDDQGGATPIYSVLNEVFT